MESVSSSDHPSVDSRDEKEDDVNLDGEDEDLSCAPVPGAIAFPADYADGVGGNNKDFIDNYDMLNSVDNEYTLSEQMVHYVGGHIMPEHWMACKATLVFHAGATVCQMKPTTEARSVDAGSILLMATTGRKDMSTPSSVGMRAANAALCSSVISMAMAIMSMIQCII